MSAPENCDRSSPIVSNTGKVYILAGQIDEEREALILHQQGYYYSVLQGRTPTYKDLARLPYCLQVFKEVMRLYPPAYAFSRRALRDVEIDGYRVPKGRVVLLAPYTLRRRAEYFPDPERFDPERFTAEREKLLPRYAYLPFGAGPRICIGMYFALLEGQLLLATLAQRVSFSLVPGQTIEPDPVHRLALRPAAAVNVVVKKR